MKKVTKAEILQSSFSLIEEKGWSSLNLMDVSNALDTKLSNVLEWVSDKTDILIAYGRQVDLDTLSECNEVDLSLSEKDRLFDVLMTRFDIISEQRTAILNILRDIKCDPIGAFIALPHLSHSMKMMIEGAGLKTSGIKGSIFVYAIGLAYLRTVQVWCKDETVDLSKTMAALDKNLTMLERFLE